MPIKRPPKNAAAPAAMPDLKLVDELVKKSLEINPSLRGRQNTQQFLSELREQAVAAINGEASARAQPRAAGLPSSKSSADRRQQTVQLFLSQQSDDFERSMAELRAQIAAIEEQQQALRRKTIDEIVDLITVVMSAGATPADTQQTLKAFRPLLSQLGVSDVDLVKEARRRQ